MKNIERAGRVCYKSEEFIKQDSWKKFIERLIKQGHEAVLEHEKITVTIICDRGVSHELVRHRIASYAQESTRYCNYSKSKFQHELTFISPCFWAEGSEQFETWEKIMKAAESAYFELLSGGATPEQARSVLPSSLKTEIVVTMNLREWRYFLKLRTAKDAHPQMREIAISLHKAFNEVVPIIFDDIEYEE